MPPIETRGGSLERIYDIHQWHLIDVQAMITVLVVLPIVAYPFLPSVRHSGIRCEVFLLWPSLATGLLLKSLEHGNGEATTPDGAWLLGVSAWQAILLAFSLLAGLQGLRAPRDFRAVTPRDYSWAQTLLEGVVFIPTMLFIDGALPPLDEPELGWVLYVLRGSAHVVGCTAAILAAYVFLGPLVIAPALCRFMTRKVSWWCWLPENGGAHDFAPRWSVAVAVTVAAAPVLVFVVAIM